MLALIVLQSITLLILFIFFLNALTNLWALKRINAAPLPKEFPPVSILVPTRNEEKNIRKCLSSLLKQDYPDYEVLVLNDNSTDKTQQILASFNHPKLKIFNGLPLPKDWLGKHWACHQLTQHASKELFLFTDADTHHHPHTLKYAVSSMLAQKADFISILPKEKTLSMSELLAIPMIPWSLNTFMPLALAERSKNPSLSASIGQFMLFKRKAYHYIGGYPAIRDQVLDDVTFGKKVKAFGLTWRMFDGTQYLSCRMYRNFKEIFEGFTKNIFAVFKNNIFYFFFAWFILIWVLLGPFAILLLWLLALPITFTSVWLALSAIFITFLTWVISNFRFRFPFLLSFLYPLTIATFAYISLSSMVYTLAGKTTWKGRKLIKRF
jgi:chlorobactene glucosyltransferase